MADYFIYDIETYPNIFSCVILHRETGQYYVYEIGNRRNDRQELVAMINYVSHVGGRMVGFNNMHFDYPVIHQMYFDPYSTAESLYNKAKEIITSSNKFGHIIWPRDQVAKQIDLFKIHHFDNRAKSTSLKLLQINMRSPFVQDLPYTPGTNLTHEQMDELIKYNTHDVEETARFFEKSLDAVAFRDELTEQYGRDFTNANDKKIGTEIIIQRLETESPGTCYYYDSFNKRQPRQTHRDYIELSEIILPYIHFQRPEFNRVLEYLKAQKIATTKGVFKDLHATLDGFRFDFGTGGVHGSVDRRKYTNGGVVDIDVTSYYPSLAIVNNFYPEHLGQLFCSIYSDIKQQRLEYPKTHSINKALKLALNGTFGDSNNEFSPFRDPRFTMQITINGQLLLCMLAERLMNYGLIQINTDGLTLERFDEGAESVLGWWERLTGLTLETAHYKRMFVRDVNNYLAEYEDGQIKRKGAYEYELQWHQNHSGLVVPKAVEACLLWGIPIEEFIRQYTDAYDFMITAKVPRSSRLYFGDRQEQNTSRYYIGHRGEECYKMMPPLKGKDQWRKIGINVGWKTVCCNDVTMFDWYNLDYNYYIQKARELLI